MTQATVANPASTASKNKVEIEDVGPARKRLTITVPADSVSEKLEESMGTLATQTAVPGFRKGKVPKHLIERRFGSTVRAETKNQIIAGAYAAAIEEHKLKPVGEPEPGENFDKVEVTPGKDLTFELVVEIVPDFTIPALDKITIKKPMLEINDEHIEGELKRQQLHHGNVEKIDADFKEGDRLGGYATVTKNDEKEPFFRQDNVLVMYPGADGKSQVLGLMIDDLGKLLKGKKVSDAIEIKTTGPDMHERDDLRGAKLLMTYEIRGAERVTPITPDEVAAKFGLANEAMLREQIKLALEHRRDEEQAAAMREQAVEQVAEMIEMELPEKLSARQAASTLERARLNMLYMGMNTEEADERLAMMRDESEIASKARLKIYFMLHRLAEHFSVEVNEQEVNGRIAAIAAQKGVRPEKLRAELMQNGQLGEVASNLRDQKTADRLVQQAKKVEVSSDAWNKYMTEKKESEKKSASEKAKRATTSIASKKGKPAADDAEGGDEGEGKVATKKKTTKKK